MAFLNFYRTAMISFIIMKFRKNQRLIILIACAILIRVFLTLYLFRNFNYNPIFDGDSCSRIIISDNFIRDVNLYKRSADWLNMNFWIFGLGMFILRDAIYAPVFINVIFSLCTLVVLYFLVRKLFPGNDNAAFFASGIVAINPLLIGISLSALAEPGFYFFIVSGVFCWLKYVKEKHGRFIVLSSIFFFFSTGLRYEGWFFVFTFSLYAVYRIFCSIKGKTNDWKLVTTALAISWLFIIYWLFINKIQNGDFLAFYKVFLENNIHGPRILGNSRIEIIKNILIRIYRVNNFWIIMGFLSGIIISRMEKRDLRILYIILPPFFMLLISYLRLQIGGGGSWVGKTYALFYILFIPFVAFAFDRITFFIKRNTKIYLILFILLFIFLKINNQYGYDPKNYLPVGAMERNNARKIGILIRKLYKKNIIPKNNKVLIELHTESYGSHFSNIWNSLHIKIFHPEKIFFDRNTLMYFRDQQPFVKTEGNPSIFDKNEKELKEYLYRENIALLITVYPETTKKITDMMPFLVKIGTYNLFINTTNENYITEQCRYLLQEINRSWRYYAHDKEKDLLKIGRL